jgi:hypothetical protein
VPGDGERAAARIRTDRGPVGRGEPAGRAHDRPPRPDRRWADVPS